MNTARFFAVSVLMLCFAACNTGGQPGEKRRILGQGQMPDIAGDQAGSLYVVYGNGDSIFYTNSDDAGITYSTPSVVGILPGLAASHMRGPQIAVTATGICIIAATNAGDIFAYKQDQDHHWYAPQKLNDADTVAKEGLMDLQAEGDTVFAVWLDLRDGHNKIVGTGSVDGGKTWSANTEVYASPDSSVCECCKPSVAIMGGRIYILFRNWIGGNRDMYLVQSADAGKKFGPAERLGTGHWALNGCPMDGGGIQVEKNGIVQTVWRRQNKIYSCRPGEQEVEIGEGKGCQMTVLNHTPVYTWTEKGGIVCLLPSGRRQMGKGRSQVIQALGKDKIALVWENENRLYTEIISL